MKGRWLILAAMAALTSLLLASPLAAEREAGKMPITIGATGDAFLAGSGTASAKFTLELGAASDSGQLTFKYSYGLVRRNAAGQLFRPARCTETFKGKQGTLVIRSAGRQFPIAVVTAEDPGADAEVWTGTWSVVSGTGRISGYSYRYDGFVTRS